jgi:hypothetical protein
MCILDLSDFGPAPTSLRSERGAARDWVQSNSHGLTFRLTPLTSCNMGSIPSRRGLPSRFPSPPLVPGPDADGQAIHDAAWGRPYPFETTTLNNRTFRFYKRDDPLATFFLDDIMNLESRILIREEYRLAYDYFDRLQAEQTNKSPIFILTGQPGIGALPART